MRIEDYEQHKADIIFDTAFKFDSVTFLPNLPMSGFYTHLGVKRWEIQLSNRGGFSRGIFANILYNDDPVVQNTVNGLKYMPDTKSIISYVIKNISLATIHGLYNDRYK